jgi:hypothetical protein
VIVDNSAVIDEEAPLAMVETAAAIPHHGGGRLPALSAEPAVDRRLWITITALVIAAFFLAMMVFWVPAHPGTDQNGYLVGGKMFARTGSTGFKPVSPYEFVGRMWVEVPGGKFFPKYPLGLSVIYAIALKIGGARWGIPAAMMVNPVAMTLALVASFLFIRMLCNSFWALLGTLLIATSPVCIGLTDNPNSHATAICCIAWGMFLLFRWWQRDGLWRAILAGLLIGTAVTIRYTEGMVIAAVVAVALLKCRWQDRRWWIETTALLCSWALPVLILTIYNLVSMHHLTGYDPTNESTGFTFQKFCDNWETMLREMYNTGLFFTLPFALLGGVLMFKWNWRVSTVLAVWIVPNLVLYSAYYWAPDGSTISYLRFTLTIFPALAVVTVFAFKWITDLAGAGGSPVLSRVAVGVVIAAGCAVNLNTALGSLATDTVQNRSTLEGAQAILRTAPAGSVIFSDQKLLNFFQLAGNYDLYDLQQFDRKTVEKYAEVDPDAPTGLQPQRAAEIYQRLKNDTQSDLIREQNKLMTDALAAGHRVFLVVPSNQFGFSNRFLNRRLFTTKLVNSWFEPAEAIEAKKKKWLGMNPARILREKADRDITWDVLEVKTAPVVIRPAVSKTHSTQSRHTSRATKPSDANASKR